MASESQTGATLLETLIATSITAMIIVAAATVLQQGNLSLARQTADTLLAEDQVIFERVLRERALSAVWVGLNEDRWRFMGNQSSVSFVGFDGQSEIVRTTVQIEDISHVRLSIQQVTEGEAMLLDTVFQVSEHPIELRYLVEDETGRNVWADKIESDRPALLISMITTDRSQTDFRIDVDFPPKSPLRCDYDPVSRVCSSAFR